MHLPGEGDAFPWNFEFKIRQSKEKDSVNDRLSGTRKWQNPCEGPQMTAFGEAWPIQEGY